VFNVIKSGNLRKWKRETRFQGAYTRSVLTNLDIFGERLPLQLSPFYYYCQLDDGFFAVALEDPVGSATLDFFKIEPRAFSIVSTNSRFLSPNSYFIHPLDRSAFFNYFPYILIALC
jgi:hypothetical protein